MKGHRYLFALVAAASVVAACGSEVLSTAPSAGPSELPSPPRNEVGSPPTGSAEQNGASDPGGPDGASLVPLPNGDASSDASSAADAASPWAPFRASLGGTQSLSGRCSTYVEKLVATKPTCSYVDVPTLSGAGPCLAKVTFADDAATGSMIATVQELAPEVGQLICHADVVAVVPPVTTTIAIPLTLRPDGSVSGTGSRPATDTQYTLTATPGMAVTLQISGLSPSRVERTATVNQGGCPAPLAESTCSFSRQL